MGVGTGMSSGWLECEGWEAEECLGASRHLFPLTTTIRRMSNIAIPDRDPLVSLMCHFLDMPEVDKPLSYGTILQFVGLEDGLLMMKAEPRYTEYWNLVAYRCARCVEHIDEQGRIKTSMDVVGRYLTGAATERELMDVINVAASGEASSSLKTLVISWSAVHHAAKAALAASRFKVLNTQGTQGFSKEALKEAEIVSKSACHAAVDARYAVKEMSEVAWNNVCEQQKLIFLEIVNGKNIREEEM